MNKWMIAVLVVAFTIGSIFMWITYSDAPQAFAGCELTITCKGYVKEAINVQVISGGLVEAFGVVGAGPKGRDGRKTTAFGPFKVGEEVTVRWGVDGIDFLDMRHRKVFDTRKYLPYIDHIRAVEFVFHGGDEWEMKVYDSNGPDEDRNEIIVQDK